MSHTEYLESDVGEYVETAMVTADVSDNLNESNTKKRIIEPFIQLLEWPLQMPEDNASVELQYEVGDTDVDYALVENGNDRVFVDAFAFDEDIDVDEESMRSAFNKFDWGIVTNGYVYEIYRKVDRQLVLVDEIDIDEMEDRLEFLSYMSFDSLTSGRTEEESRMFEECVRDKSRVSEMQSRFEQTLQETLTTIDEERIKDEVELMMDSLIDMTNIDSFFGSENLKASYTWTDNLEYDEQQDQDNQRDRGNEEHDEREEERNHDNEEDEEGNNEEEQEEDEEGNNEEEQEGDEGEDDEDEHDDGYRYEPLHSDSESSDDEDDDDESGGLSLGGIF